MLLLAIGTILARGVGGGGKLLIPTGSGSGALLKEEDDLAYIFFLDFFLDIFLEFFVFGKLLLAENSLGVKAPLASWSSGFEFRASSINCMWKNTSWPSLSLFRKDLYHNSYKSYQPNKYFTCQHFSNVSNIDKHGLLIIDVSYHEIYN